VSDAALTFRAEARRRSLLWAGLVAGLGLTALAALALGRYPIPPERVLAILAGNVLPVDPAWSTVEEQVVEALRLPRVLVAMTCGAALAAAGVALQGTFRNPLVGPQIIGVSSGAGFGGALAILMTGSQLALMGGAFVFGLLAMAIVLWLSRVGGRSPVLMLVLAGVVTSAMFTALTSLVQYVADPEDKLPAIVFWLMGSFSTAGYDELAWLLPPVLVACGLLFLLRWRINVLSLGDEEAESLGVSVNRARLVIVVCVAAIAAAVVAVAGVVGWVGLVVPHLARMIVGPDHRILLPVSMVVGGGYLVLIDTVARTATTAEIPLGVLTALIGAPVFGYLLKTTQARGWSRD
jgi:iron complex transport system permease protein